MRNWNDALLQDLGDALDMHTHRDKRLKVMVTAALASGAAVTLLDQPFAALDLMSIRIIQEFLHEAANHPSRAWIVADYEVPASFQSTRVLQLT